MSAALEKALDSVDFAGGFFMESFGKDGRKEECLFCDPKARQSFQHGKSTPILRAREQIKERMKVSMQCLRVMGDEGSEVSFCDADGARREESVLW